MSHVSDNWKDPEDNILAWVYYAEDVDPFIYAVNGNIAYLEELDKEFSNHADNGMDYFSHGDGDYLFKAVWFSGQYDEYGRCELEPCYEVDFVAFNEST